MMKKRYAALFLFVTLIAITTIGFAMGFFDFAKVCLYSEVSGVVTLNGKPVAGAEVIRKAWWPDEKLHTDTITTDAQGKFHFAPMYVFSLLSQYVPAEVVIEQQMLIRYQSKDYPAWSGAKRDFDVKNEFEDSKPRTLICELTEEPVIKGEKFGLRTAHSIETICKW